MLPKFSRSHSIQLPPLFPDGGCNTLLCKLIDSSEPDVEVFGNVLALVVFVEEDFFGSSFGIDEISGPGTN